MRRGKRVGVCNAYTIIFCTEDQDGPLARAILLDRFRRWVDRPFAVPSVVDAWPETVQCPIILMGDEVLPLRQQIFKLLPSLPSVPVLGLAGGICSHARI